MGRLYLSVRNCFTLCKYTDPMGPVLNSVWDLQRNPLLFEICPSKIWPSMTNVVLTRHTKWPPKPRAVQPMTMMIWWYTRAIQCEYYILCIFVQFCAHLYNYVQFSIIQCNSVQLFAILCNSLRFFAFLWDSLQFRTIVYNCLQFFTILCNFVQNWAFSM